MTGEVANAGGTTGTAPASGGTGSAPPAATGGSSQNPGTQAPNGGNTPPPTGTTVKTGTENNAPQTGADWKIPDAYKDKPWSAKITNADDLWKTLDNAQSLIGKKTVTPDWVNAKPEEIESYYASTRPADKTAYQFGEGGDAAFNDKVADVLYKNGISSHQANAVIEGYNGLIQSQLTEATSKEGWETSMKTTFGDKYTEDVAAVVNGTKGILSPEDQQVLNSMPNQYMGVLFKAVRGIQKAYGANDGGAALNANTGTPAAGASIADQIAANTAALDKLTTGPHTQQQKDDLLKQRDTLFQKKLQAKK